MSFSVFHPMKKPCLVPNAGLNGPDSKPCSPFQKHFSKKNVDFRFLKDPHGNLVTSCTPEKTQLIEAAAVWDFFAEQI